MVSSADGGGTYIAVHWRADATYAGGMPNATAPGGKRISFTGTDVIRIQDGRVAEYWLVTDTMAMFAAFGMSCGEHQPSCGPDGSVTVFEKVQQSVERL